MLLPVEVLAERAAYAVECDWIDAAVHEGQTKAEDAKVVPERVVILLSARVKVEPEHEHVLREEAYSEHSHKCHHHFRHLLTGLYLLYLR